MFVQHGNYYSIITISLYPAPQDFARLEILISAYISLTIIVYSMHSTHCGMEGNSGMGRHDYEYVLAVSQEGNFSKAAQRLYISQPALSAAVKKLERELHGVPLFDRAVTPVKLTKAGRFYLEKAEIIDRLESEIDLYFSTQAGKRSGTLTIGSASFFCTYVLPGILRGYHEVNPECEIDMIETNVDQADSRLRKGEIDLLLDVEKMDEESFESMGLGKEYILLAVPASFSVNEKLKDCRISRGSIISRDFLKGDVPPGRI